MSSASAQRREDGALAATSAAQARASDPGASAWVSANAGTGKTFVLTRRVVRLLLAGVEPQRILGLTYTKAAAAEMSRRVLERLAGFVMASEAALAEELSAVLDQPAAPAEMARARTLFAATAEAAGGLGIMTIHAFAERLLRRFPLEAGIAPGFRILDDGEAAALLRMAIDGTLRAATGATESALGRALRCAVVHAAGDGFDQALGEAVRDRARLVALVQDGSTPEEALRSVGVRTRTALGVADGASEASLTAAMAAAIAPADLVRAITALSGGASTDADLAAALRAAAAAVSPAARAEALCAFFLTAKGEPRADGRFITKAVRAAHPDLAQRLTRARDQFHARLVERQALVVADASEALVRLADDVLARYEQAKACRAALDFADLIERACRLVGSGSDAQWILYKLDGGIDHILVDEAQDTSAAQWTIIERLADEFFAGEGAHERSRTLFAVGDRKQSIYRFQGAAPRLFTAMRQVFAARIAAGGARFAAVLLEMSFRSAPAVLEAVDAVFAGPDAPAGVAGDDDSGRHVPWRRGEAGLVELWEPEPAGEPDPGDAWQPLAAAIDRSAPERLADRIATQIRTWLDRGDELGSEGRPIRAGDCLILVRKRSPFAVPMIRALKARGLPVAGADRIRIREELAVMDLMALGDAVLLPEDDLALATILKSPLFGLGDDDLLQLRADPALSLWSALLKAAEALARYRPAAEALKRWRARADFTPPFEFFSGLLGRDGVYERLLARLGGEAAEGIDEFLALALAHDASAAPSLQGFLAALRDGAPEVRRDMEQGRDEVRVMTVHGAKGLEAPVVFLPDTCGRPVPGRGGGLLELPQGDPRSPPALVWAIKGARKVPAVAAAVATAAAAERAEQDRLLYVAMTRARDRLYIGGFEGGNGRAPDCWYNLVEQRLGPRLTAVAQADGTRVRRLASVQEQRPAKAARTASPVRRVALPAWATKPAPVESMRAIPIAPSTIAPLELEDGGHADLGPERPAAATIHRPAELAGAHRFLRGELVHALLEHLPGLPPEQRAQAAARYLERRSAALPAAARVRLAGQILALMSDPRCAPLFGAGSRAEVAIAAEIKPPRGGGTPIRIAGAIDRLCVRPGEILFVDYKTNRQPARSPREVPEAYLLQLAAYRLALGAIYNEKRVSAALLWVETLELMAMPEDILDRAAAKLFTLR